MNKQDEIDQLRAELEREKSITEATFEAITTFRIFLTSSKFQQDTTIQTNDVDRWLQSLRSNILDRQVEPWGYAHTIHGAVGRGDSDYVRNRSWQWNNPENSLVHTVKCS